MFSELFSTNISDIRFVSFDTETTGSQAARDHLVEIAAIAFDEEFTHRRFDMLVKPPVPIPHSAEAIHGISDEMVSGADVAHVVLNQFFDFLKFTGKPRVLLAHNCGFDIGILCGEKSRTEQKFPDATPEMVIDTCMLAKSLLPQLDHHRLRDLAEYFEIPPPDRYHRAMADVEVLQQVFLKLLSLAADKFVGRGEEFTFERLLDLTCGYFILDLSPQASSSKPFRLSPRLEELEKLCGQQAKVGINYLKDDPSKTDSEPMLRYITPLAIRIRSFRVYVDAVCHEENVKKTFRGDRIFKVKYEPTA